MADWVSDSCYGDSGGPLIADVNSELQLAGVVSWGIGCGHPGYPGVYTRMSTYMEWVCCYVDIRGCEHETPCSIDRSRNSNVSKQTLSQDWTNLSAHRNLDEVSTRAGYTSAPNHHAGRIINGDSRVQSNSNWITADNVSFFTALGSNPYGSLFCGATLISNLHLVTAAHCIGSQLHSAFVGRRSTSECVGPECVSVTIDSFIVHPSYSGSRTLLNDIALLRLSAPVSNAVPATVASSGATDAARSFIIAGLGATSESGGYPDVLQLSSVPAVPEALCIRSDLGQFLAYGMLCAGMMHPSAPPTQQPHEPQQPPRPLPSMPNPPSQTAMPSPPVRTYESPPFPPATPSLVDGATTQMIWFYSVLSASALAIMPCTCVLWWWCARVRTRTTQTKIAASTRTLPLIQFP